MSSMAIDRSQITGLVLAGGRGSRMGGADKGLLLHHGRPLALHAAERLTPQVGALAINANRHHAAYAALGWPVVADAVGNGMPEHVADGAARGVSHSHDGSFPGPLAGMLAGLRHSTTPYLVTVACDTPNFPEDLVQRLAQALRDSGALMAMAMSAPLVVAANIGGNSGRRTGADTGAGTVADIDADVGARAQTIAHANRNANVAAASPRPMPQPVFCLLHMSLHDSLLAALQAGQRKVRVWAAEQDCVPVLFHDAAAFANANTPLELQALQVPCSPLHSPPHSPPHSTPHSPPHSPPHSS